jgi:uncharacterized membrane protein
MGRAAWFALSAAWALYGAGSIAAGFIWRLRAARLAGLALLSLTVVKVFTLDVSSLDTGYRILSFAVLGAILMGVSYVYQRFQSQVRELLLA